MTKAKKRKGAMPGTLRWMIFHSFCRTFLHEVCDCFCLMSSMLLCGISQACSRLLHCWRHQRFCVTLHNHAHIICIAGLGKGTGAAPKQPKVPLAEQPVDLKTMPLKTVLKCAWAKDKRKISAEQAVRVRFQPCDAFLSFFTISSLRLGALLCTTVQLSKSSRR